MTFKFEPQTRLPKYTVCSLGKCFGIMQYKTGELRRRPNGRLETFQKEEWAKHKVTQLNDMEE